MKLYLVLICVLAVSAAPQSGGGDGTFCTDFDGYRCVPPSQCYIKDCSPDDDPVLKEILNGGKSKPAPVTSPRQSSSSSGGTCSGFSSNVLPREEASCFSPRSENVPPVCCNENDILPTATEVDDPDAKCEDYEGFKCVPFKNCASGDILTDRGSPVFGVRQGILEIAQTGNKCSSVLEGCCKSSTIKEETATNQEIPESTYQPRCGKRNLEGVSIHIKGVSKDSTTTQFGEWPNMCYLLRIRKGGEGEFHVYLSGGSLIAPGVVLTAAHWVSDLKPSELLVVCGDWDVKQPDLEPQRHQIREVREMTVHPTHDDKSLYNDFALLHVTEEFVLGPHLDTACLPLDGKFSHKGCYAMGWGKDSIGDPAEYQVLLQHIELPFIPHALCQDMLQRTVLNSTFRLHQSFNCAGGQRGRDTCQGDGGGPLMCPADGTTKRYVQVGIVAWGLECGLPNTPGVYASVPYGLCFIDWATKCVHGNKYNSFYNVPNCANFINKEMQSLIRQERRYENLLENGNLVEVKQKFYIKRLVKVKNFLSKARQLSEQCVGNSGVARTNDVSAFERQQG